MASGDINVKISVDDKQLLEALARLKEHSTDIKELIAEEVRKQLYEIAREDDDVPTRTGTRQLETK